MKLIKIPVSKVFGVALLLGASGAIFTPLVEAQIQNPGVKIVGSVVAGHCVKILNAFQIQDSGSLCAAFLPAALTETNDTNVTLTLTGTPASALLQSVQIAAGWQGTLAAARLNSNVVQGVTNDTNIQGSISAQNLTFSWSGVLAAARLNANVVQGFNTGGDITASISAQVATLAVAKFSGNVFPTSAGADSQILIGSGISNFIFAGIPNCPAGVMQYTAATHLFNCGVAGTGTLTGVTGAGLAVSSGGSPTPTITVTAAAKTDQETATSTAVAVVPGVQQFHPSAVQAHGSCGQTGGISGAYNISSCVQNSTGNYTINFTVPFASISYQCQASSGSSNVTLSIIGSKLVGSITIEQFNTAATLANNNFDIACEGAQ